MKLRETAIVFCGFFALTVALAAPLAFHVADVGRIDNGDGQFSIWNVAWVAHALTTDPRHVFDANIFYPRRWTLLYSETNLGAGLLATPVYGLTRNPYLAHNLVLLLTFALNGTGSYALAFCLAGDRRAAFISAIAFAFCPYAFAHIPHIQLMMIAGIPWSLLAFHRLADDPTRARAVTLGLTMGLQTLFCGYYAVFVMLIVGFGVLTIAAARGLWASRRYWSSVATAALVSVLLSLPVLLPYFTLQRATGFGRSLDDARSFSADWQAYLASSSYAHAWMLGLIGHWNEVLFPGFLLTGFGIAGLAAGWTARGRLRETSIMYGALGGLAAWLSFGPRAGLYQLFYATIPGFTFLRAPARFGLVVALALSVLASIAIARLLARAARPMAVGAVLAVAAVAELATPLRFPRVPPVDAVYRALAALPYGAVLELPVYSPPFAFARTRYMLGSTAHWMPLVDAYSDYIPPDFDANAETLGFFPSEESFALLRADGVRYALFHVDLYSEDARQSLAGRMQEFAPRLQKRFADERTWLYEIIP